MKTQKHIKNKCNKQQRPSEPHSVHTSRVISQPILRSFFFPARPLNSSKFGLIFFLSFKLPLILSLVEVWGRCQEWLSSLLKETAKCKSVFQILHPFLTVPKSRTQASPFGFKGIKSRCSDPKKCPQITIMERSCSNFVSYLLFLISVFVNDMRETAQLKKNGQNTKN